MTEVHKCHFWGRQVRAFRHGCTASQVSSGVERVNIGCCGKLVEEALRISYVPKAKFCKFPGKSRRHQCQQSGNTFKDFRNHKKAAQFSNGYVGEISGSWVELGSPGLVHLHGQPYSDLKVSTLGKRGPEWATANVGMNEVNLWVGEM